MTDSPVLDQVPGQDQAVAFLRRAVPRPHHAYVFAGPEGGGFETQFGAGVQDGGHDATEGLLCVLQRGLDSHVTDSQGRAGSEIDVT